MGFSENLFHLRTGRKMTQEQLAMLMGVSRQAISKWESGRAYPEMDKLVRLCEIFECDLNELVNGDLTAMEIKPELVIPAGTPPTDVCDYDWQARRRAWLVSTGVASMLLGVAGFVGTAGWGYSPLDGIYSPSDIWYSVLSAGWIFLAIGLAVGITAISIAVTSFARFRALHPSIEDFYTEEQREAGCALKSTSRKLALLSVGIGVFFLMLQARVYYHLSGGLTSFFIGLAVAAWLLTFSKLMEGRMNIERYNLRSADLLAIQQMKRGLLDEPGEDIEAAAERHRALWLMKQQRFVICACILLVGFVLGFSLLAMYIHIFWFPIVGAVILASLIWFVFPLLR